MNLHTYDYLDGNAAAGELSKIFPWILPLQRDSVRTAAQQSALPRRMYTCNVPAWWRGAPFVST